MTIIIVQSIIILVLLFASGFISGSETALTSLSSSDLEGLKSDHPKTEKLFSFWQNHPSRVLAAVLVANNFFNVGLGVVAASLAINISEISKVGRNITLLAVPAGVTVMILLFAEIFPKIFARHNHKSFSIYCIGLLVMLVRSINLFISSLIWISNSVIKMLGIRGFGEGVFLSSRELRTIFSSRECRPVPSNAAKCVMPAQGMEMSLTTDTRQILRNILAFSDTMVSEIMTPRTEMFAVNINDRVENITHMIYTQGYSRVPVYEKSIDNIIGIIYAKDLLNAWRNQSLIFIQDILRPVYFVPENAFVTELLRDFRLGRNHLAVVVDEYGGTAGVVTIEDALEELIGEIYDEYDEKVQTMVKEQENIWVVDTTENLDRINENLHLDLPSDKYENLASFVLSLFGRLPSKGETGYYGGHKFEIVKADRKRIYKVRIQTIRNNNG